jgi:hypothetical protein
MSTDTPTKKSLILDHLKSMANDELAKVQNELNNFYYAVNTDDFLDYFLPVDKEHLKTVLQRLEKPNCRAGYLNNRWKLFPVETTPETVLYKAFVDTANEITKLAKDSDVEYNDIGGRWVDCHSKTPRSTDQLGAAVRPDIAFVSTETSDDDLRDTDEALKKINDRLKDKRSAQKGEDKEIEKVRNVRF